MRTAWHGFFAHIIVFYDWVLSELYIHCVICDVTYRKVLHAAPLHD